MNLGEINEKIIDHALIPFCTLRSSLNSISLEKRVQTSVLVLIL